MIPLIRLGFNCKDTTDLYLYNATGDVVGIVDDTLATVVEYTYSPWGEILSVDGSGANTIGALNPFRYRGYYFDEETGLYYLNARYYDPEIGRFINQDGDTSTGQGILGHNMFAYCGNNPISRIDAGGEYWFISFWDLLDLHYAAASWTRLVFNPSLENAGYALVDTIGMVPVLPSASFIDDLYDGSWAAGKAISGLGKANKIVSGYGDLSRAAEFGIKSYRDLRKLTKGTGLHAHHIIEKRFMPALKKINPALTENTILSVVVTVDEHAVFTKKWREAFPFGKTNYRSLSAERIWETAQGIYEDYPALLDAAYQTLFP